MLLRLMREHRLSANGLSFPSVFYIVHLDLRDCSAWNRAIRLANDYLRLVCQFYLPSTPVIRQMGRFTHVFQVLFVLTVSSIALNRSTASTLFGPMTVENGTVSPIAENGTTLPDHNGAEKKASVIISDRDKQLIARLRKEIDAELTLVPGYDDDLSLLRWLVGWDRQVGES